MSDKPLIKLVKKPDDPVCLRASCGGDPQVGYYCVFRGERLRVVACLERVLEALRSDQPVVEEGDE